MQKTKTIKKFKPAAKVKTDARTIERIRARIKKRNEEFRALSKTEQRIQIAKDVIAQLDAKKIKASSTYFELPLKAEDAIRKVDARLDIAEVTSQVKCEVCGIGALFLAAVEINDKCKVKDFLHYDTDRRDAEVRYLKKWFDEYQLDEVESYFELGHAGEKNYCEEWSDSPIRRQKSQTRRLRMIMENIISNAGRFDPYEGAHKCESDPNDTMGMP